MKASKFTDTQKALVIKVGYPDVVVQNVYADFRARPEIYGTP